MRKKTFLSLLVLPLLVSSCIVSAEHITTGNPIGTKEGYVKFKPKKFYKSHESAGVQNAAKKGGISKIGSVDIYYFSNGKISIRVTGE